MVLDGKGNQKILTKSYHEDRDKALYDRSKFTDTERANLEITQFQGTDRDPDLHTIEQYPYPMDPTIKKKKNINIRKTDPTIGELSD